MRLLGSMMRALKERAKARGVRYQRFVRETLNT
jgi:predicted DNA binding CopG/RHH family protein